MKSPLIRLVCGECLRSLEMTSDGLTRPPDACPYCGGTYESAPEEIGPESGTAGGAESLAFELSPEEEQATAETIDQGGLGRVGRFQLREPLGGGGYGRVHRAYDPRLDRDVALKLLKSPQPGARVVERFFREARAAARLDHPNIVPLHDAGRDAGRCWIAYQYINGQSLSRLVDQHRVDFETAVRIVRDVAEALDYAHRRGVFHRDLKPSNVLIEPSGRARLTDFGLARRQGDGSTLTGEGVILGTLAYMSPEQAEGRSHQADARSDLYSLGVVLYELLCGRCPHEFPSGIPAWRAAQAAAAKPPRAVERAVPKALDRVCRRALARDPADRYPDARSMAQDLDRWLGRRCRLGQWARVLGGVAAGLLLGVVGLAATASPGDRARTMADVAPAPASRQVARAAPEAGASPVDVEVGHQPGVQSDGPPVDAGSPGEASGASQATPAASAPYVGNNSGPSGKRFFHKENCSHAKSMKSEHRVPFSTPEEAEEGGYLPCSRCAPAAVTSKS